MDRVVPGRYYLRLCTTEFLLILMIENGSANILDVLKGMVYLLKGLGRASSAGAVMGWGWPVYSLDTYMVSGKFRQDQGLQCQYQDLHHRALAVHHELHYEATLPTSPDSYVERDDVS